MEEIALWILFIVGVILIICGGIQVTRCIRWVRSKWDWFTWRNGW